MKLALALVLLSACAALQPTPPPAHVTHCGMRVRYAPGYEPETNLRLDQGEDIALTALADVEGITRADLCAKMGRYNLQVGWPNKLYGGFYTECGGAFVSLKAYSAEALTHELVHVSENCMGHQEKTGGLGDWLNPGPIDFHYQWKERGIYAAIQWAADEEARTK